MQKRLLLLSLIFGGILALEVLCLSIIFRFTSGNAVVLLFGVFLSDCILFILSYPKHYAFV
jgi:hypothetical protein